MKRALCIGINDYPGVDADLSGCLNDCNDWADVLLSRGFSVTKLQNSEATKVKMAEAFTKLLSSCGPDDTAVFTFSGHGTWLPDVDGDEDDGRDEALSPFDVSETNLFLDDEITDIVANNKAPKSKFVMILDCCHSGTMIKAGAMFNPGHVKVKYLPPTKFIKSVKLVEAMTIASPTPRRAPIPGAVLLAGCRDMEYSYDAIFDNRAGGVFTHYALEVLKKTPPPNYGTWIKEIRKILPANKYPQTPQIQATDSARAWPVF